MKFRVIHEVIYDLTVEAASEREAEQLAGRVPYDQWAGGYAVRDECVPLAESPLNPMPG